MPFAGAMLTLCVRDCCAWLVCIGMLLGLMVGLPIGMYGDAFMSREPGILDESA